MYYKDFIKLALSQFVAEIYENDFNAFSLSAQVRLLPEFVKDSIFHPYIVDAFRLLPASSHSIIARFSNF